MSISDEDLLSAPDATDQEKSNIQNRLETQTPAFISDRDTLAILAFGGTAQSAYVPSRENIIPVSVNPALDRIKELNTLFRIAGSQVTGAILISKDSRQITRSDLVLLAHTIEYIKNRKVLVTCGTYMLAGVTKFLRNNFSIVNNSKVIGVTGSMMPVAMIGNDTDFNFGGTIGAINAIAALTDGATKTGAVFAHFHGKIYMDSSLDKLEPHPPEHDPRFMGTRLSIV